MGYKLGMKLGNADVERDMTHVAVMPVVSHQELRPGDRVTICGEDGGVDMSHVEVEKDGDLADKPQGVIDVFRDGPIPPGEPVLPTIVTCLLRAGKKDTYPQDLSKALWYLVREIAIAKGENPNDWVELIPEGLR